MPSPFPGMDPYLEGDLWPDVHGSLIYTIRAALAAKLPAGYLASIDQYVWLGEGEPEKLSRAGRPDAFVSNGATVGRATDRGIAVAEPTVHVRLTMPKKVQRKRYIRLVDAEDRAVVTVIELLSPWDKLPKKDRAHYQVKRAEYLAASVNLVEIDLLRRGNRVPMGEPEPPEADYYMLVSRAIEYPEADVWAFTVRDPIPTLPVPIKPEHSAIPLDLRACLDKAYNESRYGTHIDYSLPPDPALRKPDADWAGELLKKKTRRKK
jgi:hypothetical protein